MNYKKMNCFKTLFYLSIFFSFILFPFVTYASAEKTTPPKVYIGLYLNDISGINLNDNTFMADFYLWFKWKGNDDPSKTFEFTNSYEKWAFNQTPSYEMPRVLENGWKYQVMRVEGKFTCKFDLHSYPLDTQTLSIELEDSKHNSSNLIYLTDINGSKYKSSLVLPGWKITNQELDTFEYNYETNFGQSEQASVLDKYYRFKYTLTIERPQLLFLFKTILPIIIVLMSVFTIFFISPSYFEVRSGIIITSLLSAVALQITASADLPSVGYLVLIDKIYNLSYIITLFALIETVVTVKYKDNNSVSSAVIIDRISFGVLSIITIFSLFIIIGNRL